MNKSKATMLFQQFIKNKYNNALSVNKLYDQLASVNKFRSEEASAIYRMISEDRFFKFKESIKKIDAMFEEKVMGERLGHKIMRLKVMFKYKESYETILSTMLPIKNVSRVQILLLTQFLQSVPIYRSDRFHTFIHNIFWLIEEEIDRSYLIDSVFVVSILKALSRSLYTIPKSLQNKLSEILATTCSSFSDVYLFFVSNFMMPKSVPFLEQLLLREKSSIHLRVVAKFYFRRKYNKLCDEFELEHLPGKQPSNLSQVQTFLNTVYSVFHFQPYIDFFPTKSQPEDAQSLEFLDINYWKPFINYLFSQVKNGYHRLPENAISKLIQLLQTIKIKKIPEYFTNNALESLILKLMVVVFDISQQQNPKFNSQLSEIYVILAQMLTPKYINSHNFDLYQHKQVQTICNYLRSQMISDSNSPFSIDSHAIKLILQIFSQRKQKYKNTNRDSCLQMFRYFQKNQFQKIKTNPLLFYEHANPEEQAKIMKLISANSSQFHDKLLKEDLTLYKNVVLYPNVSVSYLFVQQASKVLKYGLDYDPCLNIHLHYLEKTSILPLRYAWKKYFLRKVGCLYYSIDNDGSI